MFPYRCETFTTANVSVLNVFKTSVDTINASSITSDMTIGANLNGGSLTIGSAGATVNVPSGTINAKYFTLRQTTYGNATNTFLIDTTQKTTFTTQIGIADNNAEEVYIGNGAHFKKLILANVDTTVATEIKLGNINATTDIVGQVNIATFLSANCGVNIATNVFGTGSYVTIGTATFPQICIRSKVLNIADNQTGSGNFVIMGTTGISNVYLKGASVNLADDGGDTTIGTGPSSGNITIGNGTTTTKYTAINSYGISIGKQLSGAGYINIGGEANTTTGYLVLGSTNLDASYIRAKQIFMNSESGATNIGSSSGSNILRCSATFIGFSSNNWPGGTCCTISSKGHPTRGDALGIQTLMDNGQYIISFFNDAGVVRAMIRGINSTTVEYATSSDRRLKKNIQTMDSMLENIMRMKPCSFGWISNEDTGYGFIAQEVYEIFPHLRHKHPSCLESCHESPCDCSGNPVYYGLDYGQFTPYIVKAMQEMKQDYDKQLQEIKLNYEKRLSNIEELLNIT